MSVKHDSDDDLPSDMDPTDDSLPILYIRQLRTPQTKKKRCDWTNHHYHPDGRCNCNRFLRPYTSPGEDMSHFRFSRSFEYTNTISIRTDRISYLT